MKLKIEPCPKAGEGVNQWTNIQVLRMLKAGFTNANIYKKLISAAKGCGRDIRKDITHSIETAQTFIATGKGFGVLKKYGIWKDEIRKHYQEVSYLKELSSLDPEYQANVLESNKEIKVGNWPFPKAEYDTMGVLYDIFGKNRICLGYSRYHTVIANLTDVNSIIRFENKHINLGLCQFIVPSPMVGEHAINKTGKRAVRCLSNTCERWFLVIEFDRTPSHDDQIRLHYELAKIRELRMLVFSGNKSIHGWYDVYRQPEKENKKLMKVATQLGADPMTWIRCQYVRFPGGVNANTKTKQEILYYNYGK
jgi:hypothetical protein